MRGPDEQVSELEAALEGAEEAICRVDVEGRLSSVNRAFTELTGYESGEIVGRRWQDIVGLADRAWIADAVATTVPRVERDVQGLRKDGSVVDMHLAVVRLDGLRAMEGRGKGHYFFIRDLTERRRMESQLIFAGRMAAVGTLAAGVAHEINNPLAYIGTNIDFSRQQIAALAARLENDDVSNAVEEIGEALSEARQGVERVRNIVRDLRVFARGDEEARGPVVLRRVLDSSINIAWNEIRHRARLVKDYGE